MSIAYKISYYQSPIGLIEIKSTDEKIYSVLFTDKKTEHIPQPSLVNETCIAQLKDYFFGTRFTFDVPMQQEGTEFQKSVWSELPKIPYGETISYGQLANKIGNHKTVRAVGATNGKNKLLLLLPCHRVIAGDGNLTGYAGELWRKEWLLKHEINFAKPQMGKLF